MRDKDTQTPVLTRENRHGVVTLCLNNPAKFNTLSEAMMTALQRELDTIRTDESVRCVVLSGQGKAFCAGHDLREMRSKPDIKYYQALFQQCGQLMQSIVNLPVPVIARVHGIATAAGCQLVASCDLAIASQSARFAVSGINVGLFCSTPAVALSRNIAPKRAFDMLTTGGFIDAPTALEWGLISEVVADNALDAALAAKVETITSKSPSAIRIGKSMFYQQQQMPLEKAYKYAGDVMAGNMMEQDAGEGIDAFLEKRTPIWK
ncbi:enoyl-CoA hydratase [Marinobacterium rhizophilum]|uniref:Enoyl-CoA hydratase domain-containing protein 3, mitochondrial n=1 Tax=Marinobacterium rhizophilum TaxID=420402 RepID=A0ABY5HI16_9GAMM|nr:enoyl-CoA hydratase [Marinobacterium rhizophilum]UTW12012.1 enoyl-CoA hydratase [Marinobacterium rhizophilum]